MYSAGYTPQQYVPLYVRTTLVEKNGTSAVGDQMYSTMAVDRRYSHILGRAMAALEPVSFATKKVQKKVLDVTTSTDNCCGKISMLKI